MIHEFVYIAKTIHFFSSNFCWQTFYLRRLLSLGTSSGTALALYTVLLAGWAQEEWVVLSHLWKL